MALISASLLAYRTLCTARGFCWFGMVDESITSLSVAYVGSVSETTSLHLWRSQVPSQQRGKMPDVSCCTYLAGVCSAVSCSVWQFQSCYRETLSALEESIFDLLV